MTSVRELKICRAAWRWCSEAAALSWCSHSSRPGHSLLGTVNLQAMPHQQRLSNQTGTLWVPVRSVQSIASATGCQVHRIEFVLVGPHVAATSSHKFYF